MATKGKEVAQVLTDEQAAALLDLFPVEQSFVRVQLPRFGMYSQDQTEGKGKAMVVTAEAGMFYTEVRSDQIDPATGKNIYVKTEIDKEVSGIIIFKRKQLSMYVEGDGYTSSPIYDSNDEIVPLFKNKQEIARDTPENLKALFPGVTKKGKPKSNLGEDSILYVLLDGDDTNTIYQLNLHGSSNYSYLAYARTVAVNTVLTTFNSTEEVNGTNEWNQMSFKAARKITPQEASIVLEKVGEIKAGIAAEKAYFSRGAAVSTEADKEFAALGEAK